MRDTITKQLKGCSRTEAKSLANPGKWFIKADRLVVERIESWVAG